MTRAQLRLYLTHTQRRAWQGKTRPRQSSSFLRDIEKQLLALYEHQPTKKAAPHQEQLAFFDTSVT